MRSLAGAFVHLNVTAIIGTCMNSVAVSSVAMLIATTAATAQSQRPDFVQADPRPTIAAFGPEFADHVFSGAFNATRRLAVTRSANSIAGYECPLTLRYVLVEVMPYPIKADLRSWIERYALDCKPDTRRNFIFILEQNQPQVVELIPGRTLTDPLLQRDAVRGAASAVLAERRSGCDKPQILNSHVTTPPEPDMPWSERWSFDVCGTKAEVDLTFVPSPAGGTGWSARVVKAAEETAPAQ